MLSNEEREQLKKELRAEIMEELKQEPQVVKVIKPWVVYKNELKVKTEAKGYSWYGGILNVISFIIREVTGVKTVLNVNEEELELAKPIIENLIDTLPQKEPIKRNNGGWRF